MNARRTRLNIRKHFALHTATAFIAIASICALLRAETNGEQSSSADKSTSSATAENTLVTLTPDSMKRYGVAIGKSQKKKLVSHIQVPAQLSFDAEAMAVVGCPVQGRVAAMKANVGDFVKKDDILLLVESPELGEAQSDYLQKSTGLAAAAAVVEPARSSYERAKKLYQGSQGIALTELEKRGVEYQAAKNAALTSEAAMKAAGNKLHLLGMDQAAISNLVKSGEINPVYSVRPPLAGTVTERLVTLGELVKPDREKLLVVADMSTLWVLADVPETRIAEIRVGANVSVTVGDQNFDGKVSLIAVSVDPSTRSVPVRIEIKADAGLKPGMFAIADITSTAGNEPVIAVPASAIQNVDGSTAVFLPVDGKPNTFSHRMVSVGDAAGGMVSIISGLDAGVPVVTSGAFILKAELGKASAKDTD